MKYEISLKAFAYVLMLSIHGMNDLFIRKKGQRINIGYNYYFLSTNGELLPDIIISFFIDNKGKWNPVDIENSRFEKTAEDEERLEELTNILKGQGWLKNGNLTCRGHLDSKLRNIS